MAGNRYVPTIFTALDDNGAPLPEARLYFYENDTTTPKDTYSDIDLTTANPWPVEADGAGRFTDDIFMDANAYRIKLTDSSGVQIWSKDDCNTFNGAPSNAFPFVGAVVEFYGSQNQLNTALAALWYVMDGNNGLPNLDDTYVKCCIDVASIGTTGGSTTPTGNADSHALITTELPSHQHYVVAAGEGSGFSANQSLAMYNTDTGYLYYLESNANTAAYGLTSSTGSGGGHTHTLTMNAFDPPFYQLVKLVYLGY